MFSGRLTKIFHSYAFYLTAGYLIVYTLCAVFIYMLNSRMITQSVRQHDRMDVITESEGLAALIEENPTGNLFAEQVTMDRHPPTTLFIVRVINRQGKVEYTITWPTKLDLPQWVPLTDRDRALTSATHSEHYIKPLKRHIQIITTPLKDGRILQIGKGSVLEHKQMRMMTRMLVVFFILSISLFFACGTFMMVITLRPIKRMTQAMSHIIETGAFENGAPPVNSMITELDTLGGLFTVMTEKYANLIRAMRQTMDNVAHDFRTPLTRIRGASEIALKTQDIPAELAETLADIIEDCDRSKLQLQNLMDVRELESGFVRLNLQPLSLPQLLGEIIDIYALVAEEKAIALSLAPPPHELTLEGDRQRLGRVFANLIDNAIKYTPSHGSVSVTLTEQADTVTICVSDTGIGIPDDERELIWQRLFRGKQARSYEKGMGLGLNIVQVIVTAHGGTITVRPAEGGGTTFCVTLPKQGNAYAHFQVPPESGNNMAHL